jgi:hypothetical protein
VLAADRQGRRPTPEEACTAVTHHPSTGRWAHHLGVLLAIAAFIAAVALIIANITAI